MVTVEVGVSSWELATVEANLIQYWRVILFTRCSIQFPVKMDLYTSTVKILVSIVGSFLLAITGGMENSEICQHNKDGPTYPSFSSSPTRFAVVDNQLVIAENQGIFTNSSLLQPLMLSLIGLATVSIGLFLMRLL